MLLCGRVSILLGATSQSGLTFATHTQIIQGEKPEKERKKEMWESNNDWWIDEKYMGVNCLILSSFL